MSSKYVNLACGSVFIDSPEWINLDFAPVTNGVVKANLLGKLPIKSRVASVVYSSHFFEHIPRSQIASFLGECFRIMKPGALIRLALPDLESMAQAYLRHRELEEHDKADFLVAEMVDQCIRTVPGGEMGRLFRTLGSKEQLATSELELKKFVYERVGEVIEKKGLEKRQRAGTSLSRKLKAALNLMGQLIFRVWLLPLPAAFKTQNVSLAEVGERHHWVWDFHQLRKVLQVAGFINVARMSASTTTHKDFPVSILDLHPDGEPRKGRGSMYVEATRPTST